MAFPLTHLIVAHRIAIETDMADPGDFLLGSIAPDAVHFRRSFEKASMAEIGQAKKTSHLCPVSDELWGRVTDNDGWLRSIFEFLEVRTPFRLGYAVHALTDLYNNKTLWDGFRKNHPVEAAKGYKSGYYDDMRHIDALLKAETGVTGPICGILAKAAPQGISGLVSSDEVGAIKESILQDCQSAPSLSPAAKKRSANFVSYDDMQAFISDAWEFCAKLVFQSLLRYP